MPFVQIRDMCFNVNTRLLHHRLIPTCQIRRLSFALPLLICRGFMFEIMTKQLYSSESLGWTWISSSFEYTTKPIENVIVALESIAF